ncbi:MAG: tRNA (N(6)-L-threonylcarbamoyladenosine(37)-C(2))-methylthiotransferase MtaB [Holosporales bacterium]|jgi:threonylcarbamoyladenosine tRNA methylthiotransferase MtaB|nr:tRNA (N(6)-L-threonylcarbamoyladenosine(37)-C(2))-methylthiotransferase MtaB [Holosporales bacterium]
MLDKKRNNIKTITLGCRFNFYESEVSKAIVNTFQPDSDVIIVNTCSVTHEAERQSKQTVRKVIRENPNAKIIVTGCAAETDLEYFKNLKGVFKIISNKEKNEPSSYFDISNNIPKGALKKEFDINESDRLFENKARAFLQIQNGCDHFCTYCIVPFARGASKSLPSEVVLNRVEHFIKLGFKEIVLSGIDIASYGKDLGNMDLADLISSILNGYPQMKRLRISSIDPNGVDSKLLDLFINETRIMPYFHLSIQSGDNVVLQSMRRRHSREKVLDICDKILTKRKDAVLGGDFIAGFPIETEEMFMNSLSLIDSAHLSLLHIFPYSSRAGTIAASMIQLPQNVIFKRAQILHKKAQKVKNELFERLVGERVSGIVEKFENGISFGKTDSFLPFRVQCPLQQNDMVEFFVSGFDKISLILSKD